MYSSKQVLSLDEQSWLIRFIRHFLSTSSALTELDLYRYMGFPENWK